jgi:hypothetical protein
LAVRRWLLVVGRWSVLYITLGGPMDYQIVLPPELGGAADFVAAWT